MLLPLHSAATLLFLHIPSPHISISTLFSLLHATMRNDKETTRWTSADEALLVKTLAREKAKGNWGDNNLKPVAFTACKVALAGSESILGGITKEIQAIKS